MRTIRFIRHAAAALAIAAVALAGCKDTDGDDKTDEVKVTGVTLNSASLDLTVAQNATLKATVEPEDAADTSVNWTSSKPEVATVIDGVVIAEAAGVAVIVVTTTDGGKTAVCTVTVTAVGDPEDPEKPEKPTDPAPPVLTTLAATGITATGATLGGNITSTGTPAYTARGVCYGTAHNPTVAGGKVASSGAGTGNFTVAADGLTPKTLYYARAYAVYEGGTAYGNEVSFTTAAGTGQGTPAVLTTGAVGDITDTQALFRGSVTGAGSPAYTERGFCYSDRQTPSTNDNKTPVSGAGTGAFSAIAKGLKPGTFYFVRAYAVNTAGTAYGNEVTFTTAAAPSLPKLTTSAATGIGDTQATLGGIITSAGNPPFTERGVCYGTGRNPDVNGPKATLAGAQTGSFSATVRDLTRGTTYYARAYAVNATGTAYGNEISFITVAGVLPEVVTISATNITTTGATLAGSITSAGNPPYYERGVCYGTSANPTVAGTKAVIGGSVAGTFSAQVDGLKANTRYYARAYATSTYGTAYGTAVSFTTAANTLPKLITSAAIDITTSSATLGGVIIDTGDPVYYERGVCYSKWSNPARPGVVIGGSGTGTFSTTVELIHNTKYYVRTYAISTFGTVFGDEVSFTTKELAAPTNLKAVAVSSSQVNLTWNPVPEATGYIVQRGRAGLPIDFTPIATGITTTNYEHIGLPANSHELYRVIAYNKGGESKPSTSASVTTPK